MLGLNFNQGLGRILPIPAEVIPVGIDHYLDTVAGDDGNDGLTSGAPKATIGAISLAAGDTLHIKGGSSFSSPLTFNPDYLSILKYGGGADFIIDTFIDIKGVTGDWTEVDGSGNASPGTDRWKRTIALNASGYNQIVFNGVGTARQASSIANVDALYEWRHSSGVLYIHNVGNPADILTSLQNVSDQTQINLNGRRQTLRNFKCIGGRSGVGVNDDGSEITDFHIQFQGNKGVSYNYSTVAQDLGHYLERGVILDIGLRSSGTGEHGVHFNGTANSEEYLTVTIEDVIIDHCGEDCLQLSRPRNARCNLLASAPGLTRLSRPNGGENPIDQKVGYLYIGPGVWMQSTGSMFAPITTQGNARGIEVVGPCAISACNVEPALQNQEQRCVFNSKRGYYYSRDLATLSQYNNGRRQVLRYNVIVNSGSSSAYTQGIAYPKVKKGFNTYITLGSAPAAWRSRTDTTETALITALTHDGIDDGNGFYTASISKDCTTDSYLGFDEKIEISGLGGGSAGYNGTFQFFEVTQFEAGHTVTIGKFKIPADPDTPSTADLTGLVVTVVPTVEEMVGNAYDGSSPVVRIGDVAKHFPAAVGPNYISERSSSNNRHVQIGGSTYYNKAQVEAAAPGSAGDLVFDSGEILGGADWFCDETAGSTSLFNDIITVTSITVADSVATVVCGSNHRFLNDELVCIDDASPEEVNGWHFVTVVDATTFTFEATRGLADQVATGTIICFSGRPLRTSRAYKNAPTEDFADYLEDYDAKGFKLLAPRSFGAVQRAISQDESAAFLNRISDRTLASLVDELIEGLKADGNYSNLDLLYISLPTFADFKINVIAATNPLAETGDGGVYTPNLGFASDGVDHYLNSDLAVNAATNFTQNAASISIICNTNMQQTASVAGAFTSNGVSINPRNTSDQATYRVNNATAVNVSGQTDSRGLWTANRSASAATQLYRNGSQIGSGTGTSSTRSSLTFKIGTINTTAFALHQIAMFAIGGSRDAAHEATWYARWKTFMTAIGNNVLP